MRQKVAFGQNIMICIEFKLTKLNSLKLQTILVEKSQKIVKEYTVSFSWNSICQRSFRIL